MVLVTSCLEKKHLEWKFWSQQQDLSPSERPRAIFYPPALFPRKGFSTMNYFRGSSLTSAQLLASPNLGPCGEITFLGSTAICDRS